MANFNRELPLEHIRAEMRAMRWLYTLGYSFEEIQKFSWREVDEFDRKIRMDREVFFAKYELKTGKIDIEKERKHMEIPIDDENVAVFFRYSRIYCQWCFVCKKPLSWRREKSVDSLFPLCKIENVVLAKSETMASKCSLCFIGFSIGMSPKFPSPVTERPVYATKGLLLISALTASQS